MTAILDNLSLVNLCPYGTLPQKIPHSISPRIIFLMENASLKRDANQMKVFSDSYWSFHELTLKDEPSIKIDNLPKLFFLM